MPYNMDEPYYAKGNKPHSKGQMLYYPTHMGTKNRQIHTESRIKVTRVWEEIGMLSYYLMGMFRMMKNF